VLSHVIFKDIIELPHTHQEHLEAQSPIGGGHQLVYACGCDAVHTLATYKKLRRYHTPPHHLEFTLPSVIVILQGDFSVFFS
jgi:hypothetical protein